MKYKIAMTIVLAVFGISALATEVEIIPYGSLPLLNGIEGANEWRFPGVMVWAWDEISVDLKQDSQFVYLNFSDKDTTHSGLDVFIDNMAGDIMMLHISSAHGQRQMSDSVWSEMTFGPQK